MEIQNLYLRLCVGDFISQIWSVNSFNWCLEFAFHRNCRMSTFLELSSIKTPDFFHTFTVNFALAPVVLPPLQYGVINLEMVYGKQWFVFILWFRATLPDHVQLQGSSRSHLRELASFVRPRESYSFDARHVSCCKNIGPRSQQNESSTANQSPHKNDRALLFLFLANSCCADIEYYWRKETFWRPKMSRSQ